MRYGIYIPNFGDFGDPHTLLHLAVDAEAAGWDGVFLWDHIKFFDDWSPPVVDPWVALAAIAQATDRIKLGALVTPISRRRPQKLARETVTLDHLSGGRLVFGAGLGAPADVDFAHFGDVSDDRTRAEMLDEGLDVLVGLWSGEPIAYQGTHYTVAETTFLPKPVQQPRIPVWIAGYWPHKRPFRRAARWDGVFPISMGEGGPADPIPTTPERLEEIIDYVRSHRTTPEPFDVVLGWSSPEDPAEAADLMGRYQSAGLTWWLESIGWPPRPLEEWRDLIRAGPVGAGG